LYNSTQATAKMSFREQRPPTEEQWNSLKSSIKHFYLDDNLTLEGDGGVIEKMTEEYRFFATYEKQIELLTVD
jgi:Clr5 domain